MSLKRLFISIILIALIALPSCKGKKVYGELASESGTIEFSTTSPRPLRTLAQTEAPEQIETKAPVYYDENAASITVSSGTYVIRSRADSKEAIQVQDDEVELGEFTLAENQYFRFEGTADRKSCTIYSPVNGKYLGINLKGQEEPLDGMLAVFMEATSASRSFWIIESAEDGSIIIRSAYEPNLVLSRRTDEEGKIFFNVSQYGGEEEQKWELLVYESVKLLSPAESAEFAAAAAESERAKLIGEKYEDIRDEKGKLLSVYEKSGLPALLSFEKEEAISYSFDSEVMPGEEYTVEDYQKGFSIPADELKEDLKDSTKCTGVYYMAVSEFQTIGEKGIALYSAFSGMIKKDGLFAHYLQFSRDGREYIIECSRGGVITENSRMIIRLQEN